MIRYGTEKQGGLPALAPWVVGMFLGVMEGAIITRLATASSVQAHSFGSCAAVLRATCRIFCRKRFYKRI